MDALKVLLVVSLGLSVTWAADQVAPAVPAASDPADQAEVERKMREIQETLGEDDPDELKDFVPSEPLSADVAIEFPSDI